MQSVFRTFMADVGDSAQLSSEFRADEAPGIVCKRWREAASLSRACEAARANVDAKRPDIGSRPRHICEDIHVYTNSTFISLVRVFAARSLFAERIDWAERRGRHVSRPLHGIVERGANPSRCCQLSLRVSA